MRPQRIKFVFAVLTAVIITLGLSLSLRSIIAAWIPPTDTPPAANVAEPINTSSNSQSKAGPLNIYSNTLLPAMTITNNGSSDSFVINDELFDSSPFVIDASGNVGIGMINPTQALDINGKIRIRGGNPDNGKVLTSDLNGVASWQTLTVLPAGTNGQTLRHDGTNWVANSLIYNNGTNVGIGTNNPQAKLEVNGNIRTTPNITLPNLVLDSISSGDNWTSQGAYISLGESGALGSAALHLTYVGNGYGYIGSGAVSAGIPAQSYLRFAYNSKNIYADSDLEIYGDGVGLYFNQPTAADQYIRWHVPDIRWWTMGPKANGDFWITNSSDHLSAGPLTILNNGNVGIGTNNPSAKMQINNAGDVMLRLQPNTGANNRESILDFWSTFDNYPNDTGTRRTARIQAGFNGSAWGTEYLAFGVGGATDAANPPSEKMRIQANGNVGIGTTNPQYKFRL